MRLTVISKHSVVSDTSSSEWFSSIVSMLVFCELLLSWETKRDLGWNVLLVDGTEERAIPSQELCENISSIVGDLSSLFCFIDWRADLIIGLTDSLLRFLDIIGDRSASSDGIETYSSIFSICVSADTYYSYCIIITWKFFKCRVKFHFLDSPLNDD